jgi:DNA repair protein RadA/Sms
MAKVKKAWMCQSCGTSHPQWQGQCKSCRAWNTLVEEIVETAESRTPRFVDPESGKRSAPRPLSEVTLGQETRTATGDGELDRVLGGGLVPGSLILLGGEPGIGKSTLLLQLALRLPQRVLYVSGEESAQQIRMRADRIGFDGEGCSILTETSTSSILEHAERMRPEVLVIDSIQTLHSPALEAAPGSVSQIRESAAEFLRYAKSHHVPVLLIGHITKEGTLAGPKVLEHMVDVVLQFEGDQNHLYRLLRSHKNRFGSTAEIGLYQMDLHGLIPVLNPSGFLLSQRTEELSGTAVGVMMEGARPLLLEVQALVSTAVYGTPQRSSTGFDSRRLNMLLAVLEKRCGFRLGAKDVFLNITGGLRVDDPALDLAVVAAILSSDTDQALPKGVCFAGEVGLAGEIRPVQRLDQRASEALKLGFDTLFTAAHPGLKSNAFPGLHVVPVQKMEHLVSALFG